MFAHNDISRARSAVTAFFTLSGFVFATWAVRIPAVKAAVGASPSALGLALLCVSGGAIVTMPLTGALCRRFGSRRIVVYGAMWLSLVLVLPALARSALTLGLALAAFGIGYGGINVAMNSLAVDVVGTLGRPVMPSFHAAWSLGGLAGAAIGGLAAPDLTPLAHFSLVCLLGLAVTAVAGRIVLSTPVPVTLPGTAEEPGGGGRARAWRAVLLLGVIAMCSTYGEGAVSDWGALHLRTDLGVGSGLAAAGYAAFALAEACGRLGGSVLLARLGQSMVLVLGGLVTCAGMLAAALAPVFPVALAGFALAGLGVANAFPAAMARAGQLAGPNGVAATSTLGYAGFLLGPPAIGFLAGSAGLGPSLTTVSALALLAAVLAWF